MWIETLSWMQVACLTVGLAFLLKVPFTLQFLQKQPNTDSRTLASEKLKQKFLSDLANEYIGLGLYTALWIGILLGAWIGWFKSFQMTSKINDSVARLGVFMAMLSLILHLCAHLSLGKSWSGFVTVQPDHKLVTTGMYRFARHPMYSCMLLHSLGIFMISQNWLVGGVVSIQSVYGVWRIPKEETLMIELFGQQYIDYHKRVGALWPWKVGDMDLGLTPYQIQGILADRDRKQD